MTEGQTERQDGGNKHTQRDTYREGQKEKKRDISFSYKKIYSNDSNLCM